MVKKIGGAILWVVKAILWLAWWTIRIAAAAVMGLVGFLFVGLALLSALTIIGFVLALVLFVIAVACFGLSARIVGIDPDRLPPLRRARMRALERQEEQLQKQLDRIGTVLQRTPESRQGQLIKKQQSLQAKVAEVQERIATQ